MRKSVLTEEASLKYTAYKLVLEGRYSRKSYDLLNEAGLFKRLAAMFGGAKDVGNIDVGSVFKQGSSKRLIAAAAEDIKKAVKELQDAITNANPDASSEDMNAAVSAILNPILKDLDVSGERGRELNAAFAGKTKASEVPSGGSAVVSQRSIQQDPAPAAAAIAAVAGSPEEASKIEKKLAQDPTSAVKILSNIVKRKYNIDPVKSEKVIKMLFDAGKLKLEESLLRRRSRNLVFERWQKIAGIIIESEESQELIKQIEKDKIETIEQFKNLLKKNPEFVNQTLQKKQSGDKDEIIKAFIEKAKNPKYDHEYSQEEVNKAFEDSLKSDVSKSKSSTDQSPISGSKAGQSAEKKTGGATFKDVRKQINVEEVSDEELGNILDVLGLSE